MEATENSNERRVKEATVTLRILRAVLAAMSVYAPMVWIYVSFRIIYDQISPWDLFIEGIPYFPFWVVGLWAFIIGFFSFVGYLLIRDPSKPLINIQL